MTISSSDALPARSPMPLIVHSTWRAPARMAAERVGHGQPEIVVAVRAEDRALRVRHAREDLREELADLVRRAVAHRVRQVDRGRARLDHLLDHLTEELEVAARRVLRRELHIVGEVRARA